MQIKKIKILKNRHQRMGDEGSSYGLLKALPHNLRGRTEKTQGKS
jgi:hypothetical protein